MNSQGALAHVLQSGEDEGGAAAHSKTYVFDAQSTIAKTKPSKTVISASSGRTRSDLASLGAFINLFRHSYIFRINTETMHMRSPDCNVSPSVCADADARADDDHSRPVRM